MFDCKASNEDSHRLSLHRPQRSEPLMASSMHPEQISRKPSCSCGGGCPSCNAGRDGLKVSQPHDPAELEADRVAANVMSMPSSGSTRRSAISSPAPGGSINRKCTSCEDEDLPIRRKVLPTATVAAPSDSPVRDAVSDGGQPLGHET